MPSPEHAPFQPLPFIGAFVFPGLGHAMRGDRRRGVCVGIGVLGLFLGGIFIGGIDVIDSREDRVWFYGQVLVGPLAFGVDYAHQHHFKVIDPTTRLPRSAFPGEGRDPATGVPVPGTPPNRKSIGKMNEIGTLFATIAGMMNLIAAIDAGFPVSRRREETRGAGVKK
ncbi:hypothetical protein PHYC_00918 [Phycisphaerales bacterium]|nr:hypothetical protein PHYC_00918 [Phycisphaerales bacterium]